MAESSSRSYVSPLRDAQTQRTRELILDALSELLSERPSDEIPLRDLAIHAGVSERTIYRHFPDRASLLEALTSRLPDTPGPDVHELTDFRQLPDRVQEVYEEFEEQRSANRAAILLNLDPRRQAQATRDRTHAWSRLLTDTWPELDERTALAIAAVTRTITSSTTWFRIAEEFGLSGDESGPAVAWALQAMIDRIEQGNHPVLPGQPAPSR